jgi:predicted DNA-binding transcriptional regulator AlpA
MTSPVARETRPVYLTDRQVAERYGINRATVWKWTQREDLPGPIKLTAGWDADDASLRKLTDDGEFRFHVEAERRGRGKMRIAVMSVHDDNGRATWDAQMPCDP